MIGRQFLLFTFIKKVIPLLGPGRQHGRIFLLNLSPALNKLPQMIAQFVSIVAAFDSAHVLAHLPKTVAAGLQHVIIDRHVDGVFPTFGLLMHQGCFGAFPRQVAQSDDTLSVHLKPVDRNCSQQLKICIHSQFTSNLWTEIVQSN